MPDFNRSNIIWIVVIVILIVLIIWFLMSRSKTVPSGKSGMQQNANGVILSTDYSYGGTSVNLGNQPLKIAQIDHPPAGTPSFPNDTLSSIQVPAGVGVTLYTDYNFGGQNVTLRGPINIPQIDHPPAGVLPFPNDTLSSIIIFNNTPATKYNGSSITSPGTLMENEMLYSPNGQYFAELFDNGTLSISQVFGGGNIGISYKMIWNNGVNTTIPPDSSMGLQQPYHLSVQNDGNLVVYDANNRAIWNAGTQNKGNAPHTLTMQDDGHLVLKGVAGTVWWSKP